MAIRRSRLGRFTRRTRRSVRRVRARRRMTPIRRRRNPPKMTPAMRKKIGAAIRRKWKSGGYAKLRRRSGGAIARRPSRQTVVRVSSPRSRRIARRYTGGGGMIGGGGIGGLFRAFRGAVSRDTLLKAGGAVGASIGTGYILRQFGGSLPLAGTRWGKAAYSFVIPISAAWLLRRQRAVAEGLVIGALVMTITEIIRQAAPAQVAGALSAYPNNSQLNPMPGFGVAGELGQGLSAYPGSDLGTMGAPLQTNPFPADAWS